MDDGGIRPAVNQTTKFLVSARAACWEVLSMDEAVLRLLSRYLFPSLALSFALTTRKGVIMRPWVRANRERALRRCSQRVRALDPARSRTSKMSSSSTDGPSYESAPLV